MTKQRIRPYPNLADWRQARRWTQQQAADFLGISQAFYSKLERRTHNLRGKQAKRVMERTGVPIEILVGAE